MKRLRDDRVETAARVLADARRVEEAKQEELAAVAAARSRLLAEQMAARAAESTALENGSLSAGDLGNAARWEAAAARREAAAGDALEKARRAADSASDAVTASRLEVGAKRAEAEAVGQLLAKQRAAETAREEAAAEESAADTFAARHGRRA